MTAPDLINIFSSGFLIKLDGVGPGRTLAASELLFGRNDTWAPPRSSNGCDWVGGWMCKKYQPSDRLPTWRVWQIKKSPSWQRDADRLGCRGGASSDLDRPDFLG